MPYPEHTAVSADGAGNRLLFDGKWWLHPEYRFNQAAFQPVNMSPETLTELYHAARSRFNSCRPIIRRFSDLRLTCNPYRVWLISGVIPCYSAKRCIKTPDAFWFKIRGMK